MDYTIGFTGTRKGMTKSQFDALFVILAGKIKHGVEVAIHHGCCVGADAELALAVADGWELPGSEAFVIVGHPSTLRGMTSVLALDCCHEVLPAKHPLDRNRDIVAACDELIACPEGPEILRSGTWATVRACRKAGKPVRVVMPDGTVE